MIESDANLKLQSCRDANGLKDCFACTLSGRCKALKDTKQVPCPFYKPIVQVMNEDPNYFNVMRGVK